MPLPDGVIAYAVTMAMIVASPFIITWVYWIRKQRRNEDHG